MRHWQIVVAGVAAAVLAGLGPLRDALQDTITGQTPAGLSVAHGIDRFAWLLVLTLAGLGVGAVLHHWRKAGGRLVLIAPLLALIGGPWLFVDSQRAAFPPMDDVRYARLDEVDFLDDADMVLGVVVDGEAIAYPNAVVAYPHVVHDVVGGVRLLVTY